MKNKGPSDRKKAVEELVQGRESANQLLELVNKRNEDEGLIKPLAEDLVRNILRSFTNTLLLLNSIYESDEIPVRDSSYLECPKSEDFEENCNTLITENRTGCYQRKRNIPTWTKDTPSEIDDGHVWRKYGQKRISNVKYLTSYYRCTNKYEQGCQAIKQMQRIQEDPPLFRTTYYGHHTCKNSDIIFDYPASPPDSSILLSFNNNNSLPSPSKQEDPPFYSSSFPSTERESKEEINHDHHMAHNQLSSLPSTLKSNHGDLISCVVTESFQFDKVFEPFDF